MLRDRGAANQHDSTQLADDWGHESAALHLELLSRDELAEADLPVFVEFPKEGIFAIELLLAGQHRVELARCRSQHDFADRVIAVDELHDRRLRRESHSPQRDLSGASWDS